MNLASIVATATAVTKDTEKRVREESRRLGSGGLQVLTAPRQALDKDLGRVRKSLTGGGYAG